MSFSLTSQIRRSSRSVAANFVEGYRKRQHPNMFVSKLADSDAEATETGVWWISLVGVDTFRRKKHDRLSDGYDQVGKMLSAMIAHLERFAPK